MYVIFLSFYFSLCMRSMYIQDISKLFVHIHQDKEFMKQERRVTIRLADQKSEYLTPSWNCIFIRKFTERRCYNITIFLTD